MAMSALRLSVLGFAALGSRGDATSGDCARQPEVPSSESLLLQVASGTQRLGLQKNSEQRNSSSVNSTLEAEIDESVCWSTCTLDGETHLCRARVLWVLNVGVVRTVPEAVALVNQECTGQCECGAAEFPESDGEWLEGECHTATEAEPCYEAVEWARTHGIRLHPERYEGLNAGSSFEEYQAFLHNWRLGPCRSPCGLCHTAQEGEQCYGAVLDVMANMEHYELSFEEVQAKLNRTDVNASCPMPCNRCRTAELGEMCYGGVSWAMSHGIHNHPEWYPGLSPDSTFEDFQALLHKANVERCPLPCSHVDKSGYASMVAEHAASSPTFSPTS